MNRTALSLALLLVVPSLSADVIQNTYYIVNPTPGTPAPATMTYGPVTPGYERTSTETYQVLPVQTEAVAGANPGQGCSSARTEREELECLREIDREIVRRVWSNIGLPRRCLEQKYAFELRADSFALLLKARQVTIDDYKRERPRTTPLSMAKQDGEKNKAFLKAVFDCSEYE
jgi:hypothetical protein